MYTTDKSEKYLFPDVLPRVEINFSWRVFRPNTKSRGVSRLIGLVEKVSDGIRIALIVE